MQLKVDYITNNRINYTNLRRSNNNNNHNNVSFGMNYKAKINSTLEAFNRLPFETRKGITSLGVAIVLLCSVLVEKITQNNDTQEVKPKEEVVDKNIDTKDTKDTKDDANIVSMIASSAEPVEERSVIIKDQLLWNIAKDECNNLYGKGNYTTEDLNNEIHYLAKLNNLVRGNNDAYLVNKGQKIVLQEKGYRCNVTIGNQPCKCFVNEKGEAWAEVKTNTKTEDGKDVVKLIYMENVASIKNSTGSSYIMGLKAEDPRLLDFKVIDLEFKPNENTVYSFGECE